MRIVTAAFAHETSTFTPVKTPLEDFYDRFGPIRGNEILETFRGTNKVTGGFIDGAEAHGFELIPTLFAEAHPSGPASRADFDSLLNQILELMEQARPFDGVLLELHGSMVAEGIDDGEGAILEGVRKLVGPDIPIVGQLDIHSSLSPQMVEMADVLIGRETYPEVDMAERGRECADVIYRILTEGLKPTMALHCIPMIWGINQVTAHPPMLEAIQRLHAIEEDPDVICGSIATGYPLADTPHMGSSVYIVTNDNQEKAQALADGLGEWIYERREIWQGPMPSTRDAIEEATAIGKYPAILADRNDNTGGGSPGDSTGQLQAFIDSGLEDACILYIVDPEAVAQCHEAGTGATIDLEVGGKSSPLQGEPVKMTAEIVAVSDGGFRYHGPMLAGLEGSMGPSACIRQDGIHVLLVSVREQPFCTAFAETLGLNVKGMKWIGVKSSAHFRAGFESWAGHIIVVSEPGVHSDDNVPFKNLGRSVYPLDED
ncbi:MAG: M81 family metallopeptidase [Planctomycetota bacterium]|nr:M81 family metallopeptidase [Planctomycetota bacterium]